jgi:hypothetical protein
MSLRENELHRSQHARRQHHKKLRQRRLELHALRHRQHILVPSAFGSTAHHREEFVMKPPPPGESVWPMPSLFR